MIRQRTLKFLTELIERGKVMGENYLIPVPEFDMMFIDYDMGLGISHSQRSVFRKSKDIATIFDTTVVFYFSGTEFVVDKNTDPRQYQKQYEKATDFQWYLEVQEKFEEYIKNLDIKNLLELYNGKLTWYYLDNHNDRIFSKTLYDNYKINQPDAYLDSMVEEAKLLIQSEEAKTLKKTKGEGKI